MTVAPANLTVRRENFDNISVQAAVESWRLLPFVRDIGDRLQATQCYLNDLLHKGTVNQTGPLVAGAENNGWLAVVRRLDWDSEFFGFGVGKIDPLIPPVELSPRTLSEGDALIKECIRQARTLDLLQLSAQVHPSDGVAQHCLETNNFLLADTVVCYELELGRWKACAGDSSIHPAERKHIPALRKIAAECFGNRQFNSNRFNSDLQFSNQSVRLLYELWIEKSVDGDLANRSFVFVEDNTVLGFITVKLPSESEIACGIRLARIPLNAVDPQYHKRGIYTRLVKAALNWIKEQNADRVEIRTQISNLGVHACWQSLGAAHAFSYHTFHKNLAQ